MELRRFGIENKIKEPFRFNFEKCQIENETVFYEFGVDFGLMLPIAMVYVPGFYNVVNPMTCDL